MVCAAWRARTRRDREHEEQHEHGQRRGSERAERGQVAVAAAREAAAAALAMIDRCDAAKFVKIIHSRGVFCIHKRNFFCPWAGFAHLGFLPTARESLVILDSRAERRSLTIG